ncbi:hypothetical protein OG259_33555 [Streptomyces sp. NBC_00250]|uniref:hypothetical protein n=1 Tax=Streptomyces sp. NBC_00250 TaxID=2903641 RepID=UPI002E2A47D8|nr:hypothetical protein [Streptomyces sp. NBC_00250]
MGGDIQLASKGDAAFDVVRFLFGVIFNDLPAWVRYTVLGVIAAGFGWLAAVRLRDRFRASRELGGTPGGSGGTVEVASGTTDEIVENSGTRVR